MPATVRRFAMSPLAGAAAESSRIVKSRSPTRAAWRLANQPGPTLHVLGYDDNEHGVTEYIISTAFGGPSVVIRHRYSDFRELHSVIGTGPFPVGKSIINNESLKKTRTVLLGKYLAEAVAKSVEDWAIRVKQGLAKPTDAVLSPALQKFLGAHDIDVNRLDSMRASGSSSDGDLAVPGAARPNRHCEEVSPKHSSCDSSSAYEIFREESPRIAWSVVGIE